MSFASLLVHDVTIARRSYTGSDDAYGQPVAGAEVETAARAMVQPRGAREADDSRSAGVPVGDHVIYMELTDVDETDAIIYAGERYEVVAVRRIAFGSSPHLEIDARRVATRQAAPSGS